MSLFEVKQYPLSDRAIRELLGDNIKIITYPMLKNMQSIDECFDDLGRCILLFLTTSPTSGHWCCLLKKPTGIEFFDPYGEAPEDQKDYIPKQMLQILDEMRPDLSNLLKASGVPVSYNKTQLQKESMNVSTCGRHCIVRCMYAPYSMNKYVSIIKKSGLSPDDFVTGITYRKLGK